MDRHKLLRGKPFEGHKSFSVLNHEESRITMTHGFLRLQNVICHASAINRASANINSERKRAVNKNSLAYASGLG